MTDSQFTPEIRAAVAAARQEAFRLGHAQLGSEHLLLGLLLAPETATTPEVRALSLDPAAVAERVASGGRKAAEPLADPPLSGRSRQALAAALAAAQADGRDAIATADLLEGLRRERRGLTASLLGGQRQKPAGQSASAAGTAPPPGRGRERTTDRSADRPETPSRRKRGREREEPESGRRRPPAPPPTSAPREPIHMIGGRRVAPVKAPPMWRPGWRDVLLLFLPLSWAAAYLHLDPTVVFFSAAVGVLPLAGYMGEATEHLAARTGPTIGGILNATFGNMAELILAIAALRAGMIGLVKASIIGSILGNLLLILGLSLLAGGLHRPTVTFNRTATGMSAVMLALAVVALVFPALLHGVHPEAGRLAELHLSEAVAIILAVVYLFSLLFSLKTHRRVFGGEPHPTGPSVWGVSAALLVLAVATAGVAVQSELLVHAIEPMAASIGLSEVFIGLIIIPLIGNAAEHATAILVARKGQMDLALHIALGSSTQIALLVAPLLVGVGLLLGAGMDLVFTPFEVLAVGLATGVVSLITLDGESHWFEGIQLLAVYALVAVAALFI